MSETVMDRLRRITREVHGYPPVEAVGVLAEDVEWLLSVADLAVDAADEAYGEMRKGMEAGFRMDFPATARLVDAMSRVKARHDREEPNGCTGCGYAHDPDEPHLMEAPR